MGQKKLLRFEELKSFDNVLQYPDGMAGNWAMHFKNANPITLELACGKGEYALGLAQLYPGENFIGVDLKGNRLWVGAKNAKRLLLGNVLFLRTQIGQLAGYFNQGEVRSIWITFPDPQLRMSKAKKRLTHPGFLRIYQQVLQPGGKIRLKTDSPSLYAFTKKVISLYDCFLHEDIEDIYSDGEPGRDLRIKTHYEGLDIAGSKKVHYLCFSLPDVIKKETDEELKQWLRENADVPNGEVERIDD